MMKKFLTMTLVLLTMLSLTAVAHADVISSPGEVTVFYTLHYLPYILVGVVVIVTAFLLRKFWKTKK